MQGAKGAAVADDNLPGDGFKSGAKMLHRLKRDDALAFGLDAERFKLLQVEHLLAERGLLISAGLNQDIQDLTLAVHRPPQIHPFSVDGDKHLVQVPTPI